jgi:hypothetical protein
MILTVLTVPVRVARMEDLPNDTIASTAPVRKAACSAVGTANARLAQLWRDAPAAERGAAACTLQTYRGGLATAALRRTAGTQLERLTARSDPKPSFEEYGCHPSATGRWS